MSKYISFHNHDCLGSILDSCLKLEDLVKWAKANGMPAVGVTNHGQLTSTLKLVKLCNAQDIKPLVGIEFYVTENKLDEKGKKIRDNYHLCAIAKNKNGYLNLIRLHNKSFTEDRYYFNGRITLDDLFEYKEDLIITSACIGGILGRPFTSGDLIKAETTLKKLYNEFKDDFYLELQEHNSFKPQNKKEQKEYNYWLISMSKKYGIKCIIQQDAHYYLKEDWEGHQILLCKNTNSKLDKPVFAFDSHEYYLKNEAEMIETFKDYPLVVIEDCIKNTFEIAEKVQNFKITNDEYTMPTFGKKEEVCQKLHQLIKEGFIKRFGSLSYKKDYTDRIKYELSVVEQMNLQDYIMLLLDVYEFAKKNGIYRSVGRGSMGASLILYCLDITQLDPMKYHFMFERFCSVERVNLMDADCDWAPDDKPKIEKYLRDKYGWNNVCGISTYNELTAKSAFKTVATALEIPFSTANNISALIDSQLDLQGNYDENIAFKKEIDKNADLNRAFKLAKVIEGTYSTRSQHPCANVIFPENFNNLCPVVTMKDPKDTNNRVFVTSYNMKEIDGELKYLKMDELGLLNIQIIREADKLIEKRRGFKPDFHNLDINDSKVYESLSRGENIGIFQFESSMFKTLLKEVKPTCLEDLGVITAIGRPSALQSGLTEEYKNIRRGLSKPQYIIPELKEPLADTYGLMIYQESMMLTTKYYAGFTNTQADIARKVCGKKLKDKVPELKAMFMEGAKKMGRDLKQAEELFDKIQKFSSYGFSKIHGLLYSYMSYVTAYYKVNYTYEYMTALLNANVDDLDKLNLYLNEGFRLGINILPPDINESGKDFTLTENNEIRFGLSAIKGLGNSAITDITNARKNGEFISVVNFIERTKKVDKSAIQTLLKVGAFDKLEDKTERWCKMLDYLNDAKNSKVYTETADIERSIYTVLGTKRAKKSDEYKKLADLKRELGGSKYDIAKRKEYTDQQDRVIEANIKAIQKYFLQFSRFKTRERMQFEQELLGFNITTNPYKRWSTFKKFFVSQNGGNLPYIELNDLMSNGDKYFDVDKFYTVGILSDIKEIKTKRGQKMAKLTVEYYGAKAVITVFSNKWENNIEFKLQKGNMVCITGELVEANKQYSDTDYEIRLDTIQQLNVLMNEQNKCIVNIDGKDRTKIDYLVKTFASQERKSNMPIEKCVMYKTGGKYIILNGLCWINNPNKLLEQINT